MNLHIFSFLPNTPIQIILYGLALPITLMELCTRWFPNSMQKCFRYTLPLWLCLSEINKSTVTKLKLNTPPLPSLEQVTSPFQSWISFHLLPKDAYSSFHLHHSTTPPLSGNLVLINYISIIQTVPPPEGLQGTPSPEKIQTRKWVVWSSYVIPGHSVVNLSQT